MMYSFPWSYRSWIRIFGWLFPEASCIDREEKSKGTATEFHLIARRRVSYHRWPSLSHHWSVDPVGSCGKTYRRDRTRTRGDCHVTERRSARVRWRTSTTSLVNRKRFRRKSLISLTRRWATILSSVCRENFKSRPISGNCLFNRSKNS